MKIFIVFSIFIFLFSDSNAQTDSCAIQWEPPIQISNSSCDSYSPQIIVIGDTIHIFWTGAYTTGCDPSDLDSQYSYSFDGGRTFSIHRQLIHPDSTGGGHLTSASGKNLYLYYLARVDSPLWWACAILRSTDAGVTWERRQVLGDYPTFSIASMDSLVFLYVDDSSRDTLYSAILASSDNGSTWGFRGKRLPFAHQTNPKGLIATKKGLHMVFADYFPLGNIGYSEIIYLNSTDFGFTWSDPQILSTKDSINSQLPALAGDDSGNIYVLWMDGKYGGEWAGTIIMRRSADNGITWLPEQIMSPIATGIFSDISIYNKNCVTAWDGDYFGNIHTIRLRSSGDYAKTWTDMCETKSESLHSRNPRLAVKKNEVYLSWSTDKIFYQKGYLLPTSIKNNNLIQSDFRLYQNYPNPFNALTEIKFQLYKTEMIKITIFNILGQEVQTLIKDVKPAGDYHVSWNASGVTSGVYYYKLTTPLFTAVKKMILIR